MKNIPLTACNPSLVLMVVVQLRVAATLAWDCSAHVARAKPGLNNDQVKKPEKFPMKLVFWRPNGWA